MISARRHQGGTGRATRRASLALAIAMAATAALPGAAMAARMALVVGEADYRATAPLPTPAADARAMANSLRDLGFAVTLLVDTDRKALDDGIATFRREAQGAEAVVFYYSGHAFVQDGRNYLLPLGAKLTDRAAAPREALPLDQVLLSLAAPERPLIALLDANRGAALPRRLREAATSGAKSGAPPGLAAPALPQGAPTLVVMAAAPGAVAAEGRGPHGAFTRALLDFLPRPGLPVTQTMAWVGRSVAAETGGAQEIWQSSSLTAPFRFLGEGQWVPEAGLDFIVGDLGQRQAPKVTRVALAPPTPAEAPPATGEKTAALPAPAAAPETAAKPEPAPKTADTAPKASETTNPAKAPEPPAKAPAAETAEAPSPPAQAPTSQTLAALPPATPGPDTGKAAAPDVAPPDLAPPDTAVPAAAPPDSAPPAATAAPAPREIVLPDGRHLPAPAPEDLTRAVQTELKRLDCYTGPIDGDFGPGSRGALADFLKARDMPADDLDPTEDVYARLLSVTAPVCKPQPVSAPAPAPRQATPRATTPSRPAVRSVPAAPAPAPQPPSGKPRIILNRGAINPSL